MSVGIVLMSRAPIPGLTKTRLQTHFTGEECAKLHQAFLKDLSQMLAYVQQTVTDVNLYLNYTPEGTEGMFAGLVSPEFVLVPQKGSELGSKMFHALQTAAQENEKQIIIGSDLPTLQPWVLLEAIELLDDHDLVIGPSEDGGYYLLGTKEPVPFLFQDMIFGHGDVFQRTLEEIEANKMNYGVIASWSDVDVYGELLELAKELNTPQEWEIYPQYTAEMVAELLWAKEGYTDDTD